MNEDITKLRSDIADFCGFVTDKLIPAVQGEGDHYDKLAGCIQACVDVIEAQNAIIDRLSD